MLTKMLRNWVLAPNTAAIIAIVLGWLDMYGPYLDDAENVWK